MTERPSNVTETTRLIIESGIAHLMLHESGQSHLPNDPEECSFWVEVKTAPVYDEAEVTSVVVRFPPEEHTQAFPVTHGEERGRFGERLNEDQLVLIECLADAYKTANTST